MNDIVFGDGRYGYRDLPKIASTSIKAAIYYSEEGEAFCREKRGTHIHSYMNRYRQDASSKIEKRFIVVRDPVERFLSAYKNRVCFHGELSEPFVRNRFPHHYWDLPYFSPGLGRFIEHFDDYLLIAPIFHHCRPIVDFLDGQCLEQFTHVYTFDELSKFEDELSALSGKTVTFTHEQNGGRKYDHRDLTKSQLQKITAFYKQDYELLDGFYNVEDVWNKWAGDKHSHDVPRSVLKNQIRDYFRAVAEKLKSGR